MARGVQTGSSPIIVLGGQVAAPSCALSRVWLNKTYGRLLGAESTTAAHPEVKHMAEISELLGGTSVR